MVESTPNLTVCNNHPYLPYPKTKELALDLETSGLDFLSNRVLLLILGDKKNQYVYDWNSFMVGELGSVLSKSINYCETIIGHNLAFDLPWIIERCGNLFTSVKIYDTMIAEQVLLKGTHHSASLKNTLERRLKMTDVDKKIRMEFTLMDKFAPAFDKRHIIYGASDTAYLSDIKEKQLRHISMFNNEELLDYNNRMVLAVSQMRVNGMYVDVDAWTSLYKHNLAQVDNIEVELDKILNGYGFSFQPRKKERSQQLDLLGGSVDVVNKNVGHINYGSPAQIIAIFKSLGEPIPRSAKEDKNSIGEATLKQYIIDRPKTRMLPFINKLIEYKDVVKKANTFGKSWLDDFVRGNSLIHPNFNINRTATGRLSCNKPNVQQLPSDERFRSCFTVRQPSNFIWTADYSSAELRILASLSGDTVMKEILGRGGDLHGHAGTAVLRYLKNDDSLVVDKKNNGEFRTRMKNVIFGLLYGAGVGKIAELLDISKGRAEEVYRLLGKIFPMAFEYLEEVSEFGVKNGYVIFDEKWKQRRWFEVYFKNGGFVNGSDKSAIERYCKNSPIQGLNGQMMKVALVHINELIYRDKLSSLLISSVHDEAVCELVEEEVHYREVFKQIMVDAGNMFLNGVSIEVEDKLLKVWSK